MPQATSLTTDDLLASTADLASLLAHLANSRPRHSAQRRRDRELANAALANVLSFTQTDPVRSAVPAQTGSESTGGEERKVMPGRPTSAQGYGGASKVLRRQYCECGSCKWCVENALWDRIFNEKFADPAYYSSVVVRHSSTLAEARR